MQDELSLISLAQVTLETTAMFFSNNLNTFGVLFLIVSGKVFFTLKIISTLLLFNSRFFSSQELQGLLQLIFTKNVKIFWKHLNNYNLRRKKIFSKMVSVHYFLFITNYLFIAQRNVVDLKSSGMPMTNAVKKIIDQSI